MIDFAFVHSQEHHYIPPATPDRFDASVNQYDAYGRPKASLGDGWCLNGKLAKHQKTTFRTQRKWPKPTDHGTFDFFNHQSCVIICGTKRTQHLKVGGGFNSGLVQILETMTVWHSCTKYRYKILSDHTLESFMYWILKYSRWALLIDDVPWICLWWLAWNRQLDDLTWVWRVNKYPVCDLLVAGSQVWSIEKVWSWQSFAA